MKSWRSVLMLAGCVILAACATAPPAPKFVPPVFPPAPEEPRFVYERTLSYSDNVEKLTSSDKLKRLATGAPKEVQGLAKPYDVAVFMNRVYVTDTVQRAVILFDIPGGRYKQIGTQEPGMLLKPAGITISNYGEIFVCDVTARRVMVYNVEGTFLRSIGEKAGMLRPSDVAIDPTGRRLYVVDTGGVESTEHKIYVFDAISGEFIQTLGKRGQNDGEFNFPLQAAVDNQGRALIVDSGNFRVQTFSSDGSFQSKFGDLGRLPGQFARPKGIATDINDNIYVVDAAFGNVQIFDAAGRLLMFIGERGNVGQPGKFMLPAGIDVDENGRVYVVDQFFRKIDIFKPVALTAPLQ